MNKNIAIKLSNITKEYYIHHDKPTLLETIVSGSHKQFEALKNVSLEIKKGERVGIIGLNGSGKTTLLKIIANITSPSRGNIIKEGKLVSLIDLEAGFHPDLSGIQNIYLSGVILGMNRDEIHKKLNEIVKFASIGKFIDAPLFTYSKGMKLRLGFSVAISLNPDVLVLDENISVGDEGFSRISSKKLSELFKLNKTIIIASHDLDLIKKYCKRTIWIGKGRIIQDGLTKNVIKKYLKSIDSQEK